MVGSMTSSAPHPGRIDLDDVSRLARQLRVDSIRASTSAAAPARLGEAT
jgi:hypothetical protein